MKVCLRCAEEFPFEKFPKNKANKDGYGSYCKPCTKEYAKERYRKLHPKNSLDTDTHKQCRICKELKPRVDFYKNPAMKDGLNAYCRACFLSDQERRRRERGIPPKPPRQSKEAKQQWVRTYRKLPHVQAYRRNLIKRRKARLRGAEGSHTAQEWEVMKAAFGFTCQACLRKEPFIGQYYELLTEDHIIPLAKGGTDYINNIQPLCFNCNSAKSDTI